MVDFVPPSPNSYQPSYANELVCLIQPLTDVFVFFLKRLQEVSKVHGTAVVVERSKNS